MRKTDRFLIALALAFLTAVSAHGLEAKVVSVSGKAEVQAKGTSSWKALRVGDVISKGSVISTGFKSSLGLNVDGSTVTLGALTRMTLEQLASNDSKTQTSLYLDSGRVRAEVNKTAGKRVDFKVSSPVATASVRGTELGVTNTFQSTDIETYAGSVATWASDNSEAEIASDEEDNAPETPPAAGAGNTPEAVSDGQAPANATLVKAGQATGYNQSGTTESPESKASQGARSLGGGTSTAAAGEAVVMGSSADQATAGAVAVAETPAGSGSTVSSTGRLIVNVFLEN